MNIKYLHTTLLLSLCTLTACSDQDVVVNNPSTGSGADGKTPIELSIGGVDAQGPMTRAVITDGTGKTMKAFDKAAYIFMVLQSDYGTSDYQGTHDTKYNVTRGDVAQGEGTITFTNNNKRYWDDAHARSSQLSIWAFAQKGQKWTNCSFQEVAGAEPATSDTYKKNYDTGGSNVWPWQTTRIYPAIREWSVSYTRYPNQQADDLEKQDLLFSNNLTYNVEKNWADKRLKFDFETRKFPTENEMKFYHAMSKITIRIKAGDGFKADGTDFALANSKSIDELSGFNTKGLFNIKDGEFQMIHESKTITSIPLISEKTGKTSDPNYVLEALAVPNIHQFMVSQRTSELPNLKDEGSRFVENSTNVMIQFTIDGNTYKIKSGALYDALSDLSEGDGSDQIHKYKNNGNYIPMEPGKNYVFTFTIGKQMINNISAKLADWVNVVATEEYPSNAYVTVSVKTNEGSKVTGTPNFALYRAPGTSYNGAATTEGYNAYADYNWEKGYEKSTNLGETNEGSGVYTTEWYWPNNNTFYHLRTISPTSESINGNDVSTYISMVGGTIKEGSITAKDYVWGAPFKTTSPTPDNYSFTTGYCNNGTKAEGQLYKAIGATTQNITLIQHHMTSQVFVDLENDLTVAEANRVNLTDATVQLINIAQNAQLHLGNGLITEYSNYGDVTMTADKHDTPVPAYDYSYGVLPQQLSNNNGTKKVGIKITTIDGNVYIIDDINTIKVGGNAITEWLPGKKYYYKFTLKKTGITNLEATIVDWENVTAEDETVVIQ